jgi:hypothetical protein
MSSHASRLFLLREEGTLRVIRATIDALANLVFAFVS